MSDANEPRTTPRRRRRAVVASVVVLVVVVAAAAATVTFGRSGGSATADVPASGTVQTAVVTKTDLADEQTVTGSVGYGTPTTLNGGGDGTITALPQPGDVIRRGEQVYRIDDQPVVLFVGGTPFFRALRTTDATNSAPPTGRDVGVLAANLAALGYDGGGAGTTTYTPALAAAVKRWQAAVGLPATGVFDPSRAIVMPGAIRVDSVLAQLGDPASTAPMKVTTTTRIVVVSTSTGQLAAVSAGAAVTITLPDGRTTPGRVTAVTQGAAGSGDSPDGSSASETLLVTAARSALLDKVGTGSVRVTFTGESRKGVLAVPVAALLALKGGGYGLQLTDGTLVAVQLGMFANGLVQVSGSDVRAGLTVLSAS